MSENSKRIIPIVLATDGKFAPYTSVAICSIIENASLECEYYIYVFHSSLSDNDISVFAGMSTANVSVHCMDVSEYILPEIMYESKMYPRPIYFRLFIPELLPQYEKVIYLDSDVVVVSDIVKLWETDLNGMVIGAVRDSPHNKEQKAIIESFGIDDRNYFNSGVLLINCRAFAEEHMKEKSYDTLSKHKNLWLPDQDTLNLVCKNRVYHLPLRWNIMTNFTQQPIYIRIREPYNKLFAAALDNPGIFHYAGGYKPHNASYLGLNSYFWHYAAKSPYFLEIFNEWMNFSKNVLTLQELNNMLRDIMATGKCGWRGFFAAFGVGFCSRVGYLCRKREQKK